MKDPLDIIDNEMCYAVEDWQYDMGERILKSLIANGFKLTYEWRP
ncbi:hypothetical protein [Mycobacteroides salmoniphilum]|nr:hypothetical protein [Mycobacteroides salmoniphilum]